MDTVNTLCIMSAVMVANDKYVGGWICLIAAVFSGATL